MGSAGRSVIAGPSRCSDDPDSCSESCGVPSQSGSISSAGLAMRRRGGSIGATEDCVSTSDSKTSSSSDGPVRMGGNVSKGGIGAGTGESLRGRLAVRVAPERGDSSAVDGLLFPKAPPRNSVLTRLVKPAKFDARLDAVDADHRLRLRNPSLSPALLDREWPLLWTVWGSFLLAGVPVG